jgi:hypothetical protein
MKKLRLLGILCVCILFAGKSYASLIVDTGPGQGVGGVVLDSEQWIAGQFNISDAYTISSVEGWLSGAGTFTTALYTDNGAGVPEVELYSEQFLSETEAYGWNGAYGLDWTLPSGTYWLAFEVRAGDTGAGAMPQNAPLPLADYAFTGQGSWQPDISAIGVGMRISAVPIPPALWLFGSGLLGLVGISRRKKPDS